MMRPTFHIIDILSRVAHVMYFSSKLTENTYGGNKLKVSSNLIYQLSLYLVDRDNCKKERKRNILVKAYLHLQRIIT